MITAYDSAMAKRKTERQRTQRSTSPVKVAQGILREWCMGQGLLLDPVSAAALVGHIEAAIVAERGAGKQND